MQNPSRFETSGGEPGFSHQVESFGPPGVDNLGAQRDLVETRSLKMQLENGFYDLEKLPFWIHVVWYIYGPLFVYLYLT